MSIKFLHLSSCRTIVAGGRKDAMFKVIWLLKRKPGITFDQFRDHYETRHAVLGEIHLGHLMLFYTRNYNLPMRLPENPDRIDHAIASKQSDYDCVTEWVLRDEQALRDVFELLFDPIIGKLFYEDEEHFLDRDAVRLIVCDVRNTNPGSTRARVDAL
jgi:hypothetical protein